MTAQQFDEAVGDALDDVPAELLALMDNVVFLVEDEPPSDDPELLGVYDGTPLTERDSGWAATKSICASRPFTVTVKCPDATRGLPGCGTEW